MKGLFRRLEGRHVRTERRILSEEEQLRRQVAALFALLANLYGSDKLVLKAGKLDALHLMRSTRLPDRILALERIVYEDPTIDGLPSREEIPALLEEIEDEIADLLARRTVEDKIEKKIAEKMQERHEEYIKELKNQVLKEEGGPDNPQTLKKYAELEKLSQRRLSRSAVEIMRPSSLAEVVGQEGAIRALLAKIATPYPQHVILYGPPGVGKTTVARLVLEEAKRRPYTPFSAEAKFVEVDGATLRWDPREVTNPLLGSVHDPIYQGARRDLAESGIPEPKPGLVTEAHGGVLFIDEIGEMDPLLQNKLLKVLEDKKVTFDSAYYDPSDPNIPKYIRKLFEEGAPADFVLIGATTKDPSELSPALRSRCAEVFFDPLLPTDIHQIVKGAAQKLGITMDPEVPELISEYTIEGRKAVNILADAYGLALQRFLQEHPEEGPTEQDPERRPSFHLTRQDVLEAIQMSRMVPYITVKASDAPEVGRVLGLGVSGFVGSVVEIEAVAFPAKRGRGHLRFNEAAGNMARDSVFNAAAVVRLLTGEDLTDYDVHVNVVGGGLIDGPSAGLAILMAIISAIRHHPVRQDVALTGEVSIQGKVKPVGGVYEKIFGAKQAGVKKVIIPKENLSDVPPSLRGIEVVPVEQVEEVVPHLFGVAFDLRQRSREAG